MSLTESQLQSIMPRCDTAAWCGSLNTAMERFEITSPQRMAAFLAQVAHESSETTRLTENLNYRAERLVAVWPRRFPTVGAAAPYAGNPEKLANRVYAGRGGNGDEASGDGWRYRGRGLFQLTFRDNYRLAADALGLSLLEQPDLVAAPEAASLTAAHYWHRLGLNALADHQPGDDDEKDFEQISIRINGGRVGLAERKRYWNKARAVLEG
ncbi:MAG TPA: glycoside hydrolase family 19 protein [Mariprofundaceae bacterium]|nr:glycoside hydrolase family 19 protein [Mariprofundaceae bacterium]